MAEPATALHVVAIGNAIVDIIARCEDDFLSAHGMAKGHMRLVDGTEADRIYGQMGPALESSGGSAANTMAGVASFGGRAGFIGRVAQDQFGAIFQHDIRSIGVAFDTSPAHGDEPTARSLILVTPDGERTMNTHLGVSPQLGMADIAPQHIQAAEILYLEGYLFDRAEAKAAFHHAADLAKSSGRRVALSLSDAFCVDRHRADFLQFIHDRVDIVFANQEEALHLFEVRDFDAAAEQISRIVDLAAITRSAMGSVLIAGGERLAVPAFAVAEVVDTTGAGDLYAAGVLYGLATGLSLERSGQLGSLAAAEIISHVGARPEADLRALAQSHGLL